VHDYAFPTAGVRTSVGRITNVNSGVSHNDSVTVTVIESNDVQCHESPTYVNENTPVNFWATGGTGTFAWDTDPVGATPDGAGNVSNFNNVSFAYPPGAYTVIVTRGGAGGSSDMCAVTVTDVCEEGGDVTVQSFDGGTGLPLASSWDLTAPSVGYSHSETNVTTWTGNDLPVNVPATTYYLSVDLKPGYGNPVYTASQFLPCDGAVTFNVTFPVDPTPYVDVTPDSPNSVAVGEQQQFSACYDADGGGPGLCNLDVTDIATWSLNNNSGCSEY